MKYLDYLNAFIVNAGGGGGGYPEPTGNIVITANGEGINIKDYATADVDVPVNPAPAEYKLYETDTKYNTIEKIRTYKVSQRDDVYIDNTAFDEINVGDKVCIKAPITSKVSASAVTYGYVWVWGTVTYKYTGSPSRVTLNPIAGYVVQMMSTPPQYLVQNNGTYSVTGREAVEVNVAGDPSVLQPSSGYKSERQVLSLAASQVKAYWTNKDQTARFQLYNRSSDIAVGDKILLWYNPSSFNVYQPWALWGTVKTVESNSNGLFVYLDEYHGFAYQKKDRSGEAFITASGTYQNDKNMIVDVNVPSGGSSPVPAAYGTPTEEGTKDADYPGYYVVGDTISDSPQYPAGSAPAVGTKLSWHADIEDNNVKIADLWYWGTVEGYEDEGEEPDPDYDYAIIRVDGLAMHQTGTYPVKSITLKGAQNVTGYNKVNIDYSDVVPEGYKVAAGGRNTPERALSHKIGETITVDCYEEEVGSRIAVGDLLATEIFLRSQSRPYVYYGKLWLWGTVTAVEDVAEYNLQRATIASVSGMAVQKTTEFPALTITANGTHDVTGMSQVAVNVPASSSGTPYLSGYITWERPMAGQTLMLDQTTPPQGMDLSNGDTAAIEITVNDTSYIVIATVLDVADNSIQINPTTVYVH